jgi:hypothetical protein
MTISWYTHKQEIISKYSEKGTKLIVCLKGRCKGAQNEAVEFEEG